MRIRRLAVITILGGATAAILFAQPPAGPPAPPRAPKAAAPVDLTGYWVSLVTEDWRARMTTPAKGDFESVPLNPEGRKVAGLWDPAKDEAAGEQCKAYGVGGLMRLPGRLHITWKDDNTLQVETDAGTQTRTLRFGAPQGEGGGWQGISVANWDVPGTPMAAAGFGFGPPGGAEKGGGLKVVTTRMKAGYLRKNGLPYSENAVVTEYFDRFDIPNGGSLLLISTEVADPKYLNVAYWTSTHFKKQNDAAGWNPSPCSAR
jgi:hypothetical protein